MSVKISSFMSQEMPLTKEEADAVVELIPIKSFPKGHVLLEEGDVSKSSYFIINGCVRAYQVIDGDDRTTEFYTEGDPVSSLTSYVNQTPANHYLACVENCELAVLTFENERELYKRHPKFESLCRLSIEQEYGKQQAILQNYLTKNPEERYLLLLKTRPELLQRVPQYHLATFLGVQPESLSRIRKRIAHKE